MNWLLFISGISAASCTLGHFAIGSKRFLHPMLQASFDELPKKVMHSVFHYISAYLVLSSIVLLASGFGLGSDMDISPLVRFIAINYAAFAVIQILIALTSSIQNAVFKLFQWTFFVVIAVFAWLGAG
jgi:hypothetical protein